jgi:hypothetical protein
MEIIFEYHPNEFAVWPALMIERGEADMTHEPEGIKFTLALFLWSVAVSFE